MDRVAVLASGGLDSAILLWDLAREASGTKVFPIYLEAGLAWEAEERRALEAFLSALAEPRVQPLTVLAAPARPLYGAHWSVTGVGVPGDHAPDSAMALPGRNAILLTLAAVWCSTHDVQRIAIGSLAGNEFPDATPEFFRDLARVLSAGLGSPIVVAAPYRGRRKVELLAAHAGLPLELTLSCVAPRGGRHCGVCNKCYERRLAFREAGVHDRTHYAAEGREP